MRRIARPARALDAALPLHACVRPRLAASPCSAAVLSAPARAFLLPAAKQDKKKHQQFVRRWQKRLLGDAEPIGAHVDPYDPSSPVRIAPEDQGDELEVLDDDSPPLPAYEKATSARGLMHVGGDQWLAQRDEGAVAREFEKLTLRTYTPLTLQMADDIEELTGTPYTLADDNLMLAQTVHTVTQRPYTRFNFGLRPRTINAEKLRIAFSQAVAEVYTLHNAGLPMDLAALPNRGVYNRPNWVKKIKLTRAPNGDLALAFPRFSSPEQFVKILQSAPDMDAVEPFEEEDELFEDLVEPVVPGAAVPVMDPATPEFKRAAIVKQDEDKKPFDFMSNRPVPRAKPVETPTPVVEEVVEAVVEETVPVVEEVSVVEETVPVAEETADNVAKVRQEEPQVDEVKWRHAPIADINVKFALFKRVYQLTGIRISDPNLTRAHTLGDLYGYLCNAAKTHPSSLFSAMHVEGQKAREKAKQTSASTSTSTLEVAAKKRADLGDLLHLSNVELRRTKPNAIEKRTKTGMDKVIQYALWERGLKVRPRKPQSQRSKPKIIEGTRAVPEFGRPVSNAGAKFLARRVKQHNSRLAQGRNEAA